MDDFTLLEEAHYTSENKHMPGIQQNEAALLRCLILPTPPLE